jgi:serine/threonine protein kinase/tetratricopeptide (TPR) repeat protein
MTLVIGSRLGPYEILAPLGAGGMGEVYKARDSRLGRDVAVKVLPQDFLEDEERKARFEREARTLATLNHPGIAAIYSFEVIPGSSPSSSRHLLVMELVEGKGLDRMIPEGGLPLPQFLDIATALADALSAAQQKGITHRDLKPANVMVTNDGRVKVLDFGLARAAEADSGSSETDDTLQKLTQAGTIVGTIPYMSPEQIEARPLDHRTDIFSLGVMLYEMATGSRPFRGTSAATLVTAILRDAAPPVTDLRPDLPGELGRLIGRCLEKDRERRVQNAKDVRSGLEGVRRELDSAGRRSAPDADAIPGFGGRPAIAVLPFENLSGDPEQAYFADGLAGDLITRLSLWRSFPVIARNSSFVYKGKAVDIKKVSADLGVRYVVEGSVRKAVSRVRISAQLIDATTGELVWAKTHDRELTDVFAVQDEISEAIAASLVGDLQRAEHARAERGTPESLEAWGLYQRALPLICVFTREDCARARALLERAVALDPRFSTALARLAEVGIWEILYEWTDAPERTLEVVLDQARRAVALDPRDAEAHGVLSFALMTAGDGHGALEAAGRAVELNPSMPLTLAYHAYHRHIAGHPPEESIEVVRRAMRLSPHDPVEWIFYDVLAGACLNAGRFAEGLAAGRRLISLSPNYYWGYLWSAMNAVSLGQVEEARQLIREGRVVKPTLSLALARRCLGGMAPDVDRRFTEALHQSGLE